MENTLEMNPSSLQKLTVSPDVLRVLAKTGFDIRVSITSGGTLVDLFDFIDRRCVGSIDDLFLIQEMIPIIEQLRKFLEPEETVSEKFTAPKPKDEVYKQLVSVLPRKRLHYTILTDKAKQLLGLLKDTDSKHIFRPVEDYLRSFQIEKIQSVVADRII
ncbi:hypothetical protein BpHYR1_052117, partial [Brachionus plicatilis]